MDEEARQLILMLDERAAERERQAGRAHEETMAHLGELGVKTDEIIAEGRAQREALFRILDRLDGRGSDPPV